ncbi:unnamed protein product [Cercopithifilaria johnstoni]|uniref:Uncharacterized protein n=1 Tax=Cercopithifilaria johnstoni TaxID=2874296 RepID=A0A8J2Q3G2_9BILA|nr:unnamed protein product [Cercopithifilaria johnstoni]
MDDAIMGIRLLSSSATPYHTILYSRGDAANDQLLFKDGTGQVDRQTNQQMDELKWTRRIGVVTEDGKLDIKVM